MQESALFNRTVMKNIRYTEYRQRMKKCMKWRKKPIVMILSNAINCFYQRRLKHRFALSKDDA